MNWDSDSSSYVSKAESKFARTAAWKQWLPNRGNVLFVLLIVAALIWAQSTGVLASPSAQTGSGNSRPIPYQGRLADTAGNPLTNTYPMIFRLYPETSGSYPLWEENWSGPNSVQVSDGLFSVMLGSLTPIPETVLTDNETLYLGITVGTDDEMNPRIQLGSVPYSQQARTVPDSSINSLKIADGSVQRQDLAPDAVPPSIPVGTVISWWRPDASTPLPSGEWAYADGSVVSDPASPLNGKALPDLRNRFVMGVDSGQIGVTGGANTIDFSHAHSIPSHTHHFYGGGTMVTGDGGNYDRNKEHRYAINTYANTWYTAHHHLFDQDTSAWGGNTSGVTLSADNRPAYVGLVYLVKIK